MSQKVIGFVDGENMIFRFQDMVKDGAIKNKDVVHEENLLVWHPKITEEFFADFARISYYQTFVGDHNALDNARKKICETSYTYAESDKIKGTGYLQPRVFKKEGRTAKSKSVDINLTVDMMRHSYDRNFDTLLIIGGDGDYLPLIEEVARHGKQVWLAAFSKGLSPLLKYSADQFIDLDKIFFRQPAKPRVLRKPVAPSKNNVAISKE
ncbi:NYN domain-containing protein [Janthinobacterium sp. FW305-128]|uniref:NYN domain-containing protein n=1 Tax=Janthinobacterium sp. FW305-128 TaxID=2775055 RepID=UPI001E2E4E31|nr:NYN domain-containing protein [Janthinobacterium sp. FW305-128]MCC7681335.1 NYN domain-containing protein [Janthinobacterium sp. FW305-128]